MDAPVFITGIGTGVGKTIASAIITEALGGHYWKPVQAGLDESTDTERIKTLISNPVSQVHEELYLLTLPASPHLAARKDHLQIDIDTICQRAHEMMEKSLNPLIIEGAGGLLVPLNENEKVLDLVVALKAKLIIVSRNYLGSINHSLLTAEKIKSTGNISARWIFNDHFMNYEDEIVKWSGIDSLGSIPFNAAPDTSFVSSQARRLKSALTHFVKVGLAT
ncbi:dethiobiotin synthase [Pollutibacter soli]|uniref:dethiobiotin synthase n=1 Tax=Pollutibacter soli TaxID=3034157 RepID=UPI003014055B